MIRKIGGGTLSLGAIALAIAALALALAQPTSHASMLVPGPSSKSTAQFTNTSMLDTSVQGAKWSTLMRNTLKTANQRDLFCNVSLEAGLHTRTQSKSKGGKPDTAVAEAIIKVRVLVDGKMAYPGEVTFAARRQELTTQFEGMIADCLKLDEETGSIILDESCVEPEMVELIVDTMSAASFNFLYPDCAPGEHSVVVQCRIDTVSTEGAGAANAMATVGKGSFTVQEMRLVQGEDVLSVE